MSPLFLLIKVYPAFGLVLGVLFLDFARTLKRGANKAWMGMVLVSAFFLVSTCAWIAWRGDRNADEWYRKAATWIRLP